MSCAVTELRSKGVEITDEEEIAVKAGILLHDIGHGPFSHALEHVLVKGVHHEQLSLQIMHAINKELGGQLILPSIFLPINTINLFYTSSSAGNWMLTGWIT
jgi:HD superfamily phosphohydrolase